MRRPQGKQGLVENPISRTHTHTHTHTRTHTLLTRPTTQQHTRTHTHTHKHTHTQDSTAGTGARGSEMKAYGRRWADFSLSLCLSLYSSPSSLFHYTCPLLSSLPLSGLTQSLAPLPLSAGV